MEKIKKTITDIKELDNNLIEKTQKRLDNLTKPQGSLGRLEDLAKKIVGITNKENPSLKNKVIFTLAADHGVTEEGISAFPKEVTAQMVYNFLSGGAGINVLAKYVGAKVVVVDIGVAEKIQNSKLKTQNFREKKINLGTKNFTKEPAMTKEEAINTVNTGIELVKEELANGIDIIGIGEMGIGNTTCASAITAVITGANIEEITGKGTGITDEKLKNKIEIIKKAIKINQPDKNDAIDILHKVGGFEIGGMAGIILAATANRIPVVIDGFISGAAALLAYKLEPKTVNYMIASHVSVEPGHKIILDYLKLKPLFNLDMRLGEGTGATLGINLAQMSINILTEMATFESAGVSNKETRNQNTETRGSPPNFI